MTSDGVRIMQFEHKPVLLDECIRFLDIKENGTYVDGTVGGAGHSTKILEKLGIEGTLVCLDQDETAIHVAEERLKNAGGKADVILIKTNFVNLITACNEKNITKADGILLDLGVSSYQFDTPERGFSYRFDSPLDMRMDVSSAFSAYDVVNGYSENELKSILYEYGEEKWAPRIVKNIISARKEKPIETTGELVAIIKDSIPYSARQNGHPAKQTFQAIRIEVNKELSILENAIDNAISFLAPGGRLCIITFHSLEDRIVKKKFREAENPCKCPSEFPVCICGLKSKGKVITGKPIVPSIEETETNPRAKSSKLRVFQSY